MKNRYDAIIIGSGFGGQLAAINLRKQGINKFLILERRDFVGGTWCQNTYPGAAVDVQSPLYSLSEEPYDWSQMFAEQDELASYTHYIIDKHNLRKQIRTNAVVDQIEWLEHEQRWQVHLADGDTLSTQFVINATGILSTPVIPEFKGKDSFKGKSFHTNDWDHSFDHRGKRVAIIGSGASAAQVIPAIAPEVEHLHVFQRTPHWVLPRPDYKFKPWQRKLLKHPWVYKALRILIYWALETRVVGFKYSKSMLDVVGTRSAKANIKKRIRDPKLREKVTPDFTIGCKRVILSNTLYPTYERANVSLHDKNDGIQEITERGIISDSGIEHELDLIVYSTGYDAIDGVISYNVIGRNGKKLKSVWEDYPRAYMGTCVPDFPNLFFVTGPNTSIGHTSALFVIESQMHYIMRCIQEVVEGEYKSIEVKADAEAQYTNKIHTEMDRTVWQQGGCNSWYKSKSGKVIAMFPGFSFTFRRWAKRFRYSHHRFNL